MPGEHCWFVRTEACAGSQFGFTTRAAAQIALCEEPRLATKVSIIASQDVGTSRHRGVGGTFLSAFAERLPGGSGFPLTKNLCAAGRSHMSRAPQLSACNLPSRPSANASRARLGPSSRGSQPAIARANGKIWPAPARRSRRATTVSVQPVSRKSSTSSRG
jgi:hypothetical protein